MKMRILFLVLLVFSGTLSAGIEKYFKPAANKSAEHSMKGIDFIYMINLDQRPEKFEQSCQQLHPYGVFPYRFSAVNGWELSFKTLNAIGVHYRNWMPKDLWGTSYLPENEGAPSHEVMNVIGRNYFSHCLSRGAIGIVLSHLSILQDAWDSGYNTIWVMEDDVHAVRDPNELTSLIEQLDKAVGKNNWDVFFTDPDTKNRDGTYIPCTGHARRPNFEPQNPERFAAREIINKHFVKTGARYGAYSMILRRSGIKKILDFIKHYRVFLPYDIEFYLINDIQLYTMRYDVVSTMPEALSDNGAPRYNN